MPESSELNRTNANPFSSKVYRILGKVPPGKVTTYGALARAAGNSKAAHAVGAVLRANPHPIVVPCHRVVMSDGRIGGYGGKDGSSRKIALLKKEGVEVVDQRVDLSKYLFRDL